MNIEKLTKQEVANIFTGVVEDVNDDCILMKGINGKRAYFSRAYMVGLLEEEVVQNQEIKQEKSAPLTLESLNEMIKR
jgi:hypothetical protein